RRSIGTPVGVKEPARSLQYSVSSAPTECGQVSGKNANLGRMAGMERLHHGPEILAQTTGLARRNGECAFDLICLKAAQLSASGSATKDTARSGGVKAIFIMARRNRLRDFGFDFYTKLIRKHQIFSAAAHRLCDSKGGGQYRHGGMRKQTVNPVLRHRKLGVVEVLHMNRNAIHKCSKPGWEFAGGADYGRAASRKSERFHVGLQNLVGLKAGPGQGQADTIQQRFFT